MSRAVVIGGGFAGLSAAVELAAEGVHVDVLEGRRHLGGRARSFTHPQTGDTVDNGQHLFMRCYRATREFLQRIGTADRLVFQDGFRVDFSHPSDGPFSLALPRRGPRAFRVLAGFLRFPPFRVSDLAGLRRAARSFGDPAYDGQTAARWLDAVGPSDGFRARFWEPLCIAALNRRPEEASADDLRAVVRQAFFGGPDDADLGHAGVGLSALYTGAAKGYVETNGGTVRAGAAAREVVRREGGGFRVRLRQGEPVDAGAVVCTAPPPDALRLLPDGLGGLCGTLSTYRPSPIVSVNLWLDRPVMRIPTLGLLDTDFQWAFWKSRLYAGRDRAAEGHVAVVASAADALAAQADATLVDTALRDLRTHLSDARAASCRHALVVRERRATYDLPPGHRRPGNATDCPGLFLAGDWTDTGLPATIESAVVSGQNAARLAADFLGT